VSEPRVSLEDFKRCQMSLDKACKKDYSVFFIFNRTTGEIEQVPFAEWTVQKAIDFGYGDKGDCGFTDG